MKAKCFKFVDLGDGVTLVCALDARHGGPCGPRRSGDMHTQCCGFSADIGEVTAGVIRSDDSKFIIDLNNKTITITT